jgi:hypothetical protein
MIVDAYIEAERDVCEIGITRITIIIAVRNTERKFSAA